MFYAGLIITVADVLIALFLTNFSAQSAAKTAELEQTGVLALAQIMGLTETGTRINDVPRVKAPLHISAAGSLPLDSEDRVLATVTRHRHLTAPHPVAAV